MHKERGDIGVLKRGRSLFGGNTWEIEFVASVMPQDLNPRFWTYVREEYALIGYL